MRLPFKTSVKLVWTGGAALADVFISYKREERAKVAQLADALRALNLTVWFDASLSAGEAFSDEIDREARAASAIVVCWSPNARDSRWVKAEAEIGFAQDKLAAAYVAGPDGFQAPVPFNTLHAEDLRAWLSSPSDAHSGWRSLLRRIGRLCKREDIESWGLLDAQATTSQLQAWIKAHANSPLFTIVETMLTAREAQDAERARIEEEARERRIREEAFSKEREGVERERLDREGTARRKRDAIEKQNLDESWALRRAEIQEQERRQHRGLIWARRARGLAMSIAVTIGLLSMLAWFNRQAVRVWAAEATSTTDERLRFAAPAQEATVRGDQQGSVTLQGRTCSVMPTAHDLTIRNGARSVRIDYGYDHGTESPMACSITRENVAHLVICLWEWSYGQGTMALVDPDQGGRMANLLNFQGAFLGLSPDCIGRPFGGEGEPQCFASIPNEGLLLFVGTAGDGVGSNLFLVDLGASQWILPFSTSLVRVLGERLRTTPTRRSEFGPYFDNKYSIPSLANADCYTWSRPQTFRVSQTTRTLIVEGVVQIECFRQTDGPPDAIRTIEEPITWYFPLSAPARREVALSCCRFYGRQV